MKDIIEAIDSRIKSPLFGYYVLFFIAINWSEIFYLLVDDEATLERINYFQDGTDYLTLVVYPFIMAATYSVVYPWLQYITTFLSTKPTTLRNSLQAESEHNLLLKKQELEEIRSEILREAEEELIERAKRDEQLQEIDSDEIREKLQKEINELRSERELSRNKPDSNLIKESEIPNSEQENILKAITLEGGGLSKENIINISSYDKVKTEYLLESLEQSGYLEFEYDGSVRDYIYTLTTKSKKLMVDRGVAK